MEYLFSGIDSLVQLRESQRQSKDWDNADKTRRAIESIRVGGYRIQINDSKNNGTWYWTNDSVQK